VGREADSAGGTSAADLAGGALGEDVDLGGEFTRLAALIARLRRDCPWDAEQTHRSLAKHLVEEAAETLDAIEAGTPGDLCEELGDLLIQVCFHAEIARRAGWFDIDDVTRQVVAKLVRRHPWVFADTQVPGDMMAGWEAAKQAEKARTSCLDGIPDSLNSLARAAKVVTRLRDVHREGPLEAVSGAVRTPADAAEAGHALLGLVAAIQAAGVDADQALREAVRELEARVRAAEASPGANRGTGAARQDRLD